MSQMKSDLTFLNGAVYTVDKNRSWAQSVSIDNGKIVFVGSNENAKPYIDDHTLVIDLDGKMVLPGFVDAHAHPSDAMDLIGNISLYSDDSLEKYIESIKKFVALYPNKTYYRGSGWADTLFPNLGPSKEVLDAAATKWNFIKYFPGAGVGGHCLPHDPYYLTAKAKELGYNPEIILSGRRLNDWMPYHMTELIQTALNRVQKPVNGSKIIASSTFSAIPNSFCT